MLCLFISIEPLVWLIRYVDWVCSHRAVRSEIVEIVYVLKEGEEW